jgi:hypothetical protein
LGHGDRRVAEHGAGHREVLLAELAPAPALPVRASAALSSSRVRSRFRSRKYSAMVPRKLNMSRAVGVSVSMASVRGAAKPFLAL